GSKNPLPELEEAEQNQYQKILDPPNKSLALWFRLRLGSSSRWSPLTCRSRGLQNQSYSNRSSSHQHLGNRRFITYISWEEEKDSFGPRREMPRL
ncbi:unnamed protein product, partial [Brassica rapa subsp. trilocularis]